MSAILNPNPAPTPAQGKPERLPAPVEPKGPSSFRQLISFLLLAAIVGAAYFLWFRPQAQKRQAAAPTIVYRTVKVTQGPLERTMRITGSTAARVFASVTAPLMRGREANAAMVILEMAKNGSMVKKGDIVTRIDAQWLVDHNDDMAATILQAEGDIRKRKAEHAIETENLQQTLRLAKASVDKSLLDVKAGEVKTDIERELLKLSAEEAEAKYKQSLADVASKKASQAAEIRILELTRDRHVSHRDRHVVDLTRFTLKASMDGLVVVQATPKRGGELQYVQQGDELSSGQLVMKIVKPNSMQVDATVNQAESGPLRIGQKATIRLDAFPGLALKGSVYSIGALAVGGWRQNNYIRTIPVRVQFNEIDPRVIPDLSASADIVLESEAQAKLVPLSAVHREGAKPFVWLKNGTAWAKREVELGPSNNLHAAVLAGLEVGDELRID